MSESQGENNWQLKENSDNKRRTRKSWIQWVP